TMVVVRASWPHCHSISRRSQLLLVWLGGRCDAARALQPGVEPPSVGSSLPFRPVFLCSPLHVSRRIILRRACPSSPSLPPSSSLRLGHGERPSRGRPSAGRLRLAASLSLVLVRGRGHGSASRNAKKSSSRKSTLWPSTFRVADI